jgi:DNA-binding GntR family transcriptional regulator
MRAVKSICFYACPPIAQEQARKPGPGGRAVKTNATFKRAYNSALAQLGAFDVGAELGSEPKWAVRLGVSRTTVRAVFRALGEAGLIDARGRSKILLIEPRTVDPYPEAETRPARELVEKRFMTYILEGDCRPGQQINSLDLARHFGVSASAVRDYLDRFSQFGLLDKRPNGGWMFKGFTRDFAEELFEVRRMFEIRSAQRFLGLPADDPSWAKLERIRQEHFVLLAATESRYADFSDLDERFHRLINDTSRNRFIVSFYDIISLIFHYHYQWNKSDEKNRNIVAIREHLECIEALQSGNSADVAAAVTAHMDTARRTLLAAIANFERAA